MASGEFIHFIEKKFKEHGIEKVLPAAETLDCHARRLIEQSSNSSPTRRWKK